MASQRASSSTTANAQHPLDPARRNRVARRRCKRDQGTRGFQSSTGVTHFGFVLRSFSRVAPKRRTMATGHRTKTPFRRSRNSRGCQADRTEREKDREREREQREGETKRCDRPGRGQGGAGQVIRRQRSLPARTVCASVLCGCPFWPTPNTVQCDRAGDLGPTRNSINPRRDLVTIIAASSSSSPSPSSSSSSSSTPPPPPPNTNTPPRPPLPPPPIARASNRQSTWKGTESENGDVRGMS